MRDFSEELKKLPRKPGVYLMKDAHDNIIYVGKAISLRNRVKSYFQNDHRAAPKVRAMVEHIDHFDYIVVDNEVEALILESNFIKEHRPKYNILLRDDKQYPYIKVTNEKFPRLLKVRRVLDDGAKYFGPYPNALAVNDVIQLLRRVYKIRTCRLNFDKGQTRKRPCLNYFIHQCDAPCVGKADENLYMENIGKVEAFLGGQTGEIKNLLETRMKEAAKELKFEQAAKYRDDLYQTERLMEKQSVTFAKDSDADLIASYRKEDLACVQIFFLRGGKVVDREHFMFYNVQGEETPTVLANFMKQFYLYMAYVPPQILIEEMPEDAEVLERYLSDKKGTKVTLHVPQRGAKHDLLEKVRLNAREMFDKEERRLEKRERDKNAGIRQLEELLGMDGIDRIEAYDISNISGVQNVGSMVVFNRERRNPKEYRKFKIRTVEGPDEYASQREMLTRRFRRARKAEEKGETQSGFGALPDLIIMDGGKGQVNLAKEIVENFGYFIPVMGLVKDEKHRTRGIIYKNEEILLEERSALYRYLYRIQEEVHRFAIEYHRKLRGQEMLRSELDEIPGIGPGRKKALMQKFRTLSNIKAASVEELAECEMISKKLAETIRTFFDQKEE